MISDVSVYSKAHCVHVAAFSQRHASSHYGFTIIHMKNFTQDFWKSTFWNFLY